MMSWFAIASIDSQKCETAKMCDSSKYNMMSISCLARLSSSHESITFNRLCAGSKRKIIKHIMRWETINLFLISIPNFEWFQIACKSNKLQNETTNSLTFFVQRSHRSLSVCDSREKDKFRQFTNDTDVLFLSKWLPCLMIMIVMYFIWKLGLDWF